MTDDPPGVRLSPAQLPRAFGEPSATASFKSRDEDFRVEERLGFPLDGEGQHLWLRVEKRNLDTAGVARHLSRAAGVRPRDIGYAGLKDRHAVTSQWFSIDLAGRPVADPARLVPSGCRVIECRRHSRKLRRGALAANRFEVTLRGLLGASESIEERLQLVRQRGAPNYFGEQRFGAGGRNVRAAYRLLCGEAEVRDRGRRGIYYSCARALLFNVVLAVRVERGLWDRPLEGDLMMLDGSHSRFPLSRPDSEIEARVRRLDIHPTGPLWGARADAPTGEAGALEARALSTLAAWCEGLERAGLRYDRRALRVRVDEVALDRLDEETIRIRFTLPPGAYATTVLREIVRLSAGRTRRPSRHLSDGPI